MTEQYSRAGQVIVEYNIDLVARALHFKAKKSTDPSWFDLTDKQREYWHDKAYSHVRSSIIDGFGVVIREE